MCSRCQPCSTFFFFFSSRRRHTRFDCDWSSDVCSSDLALVAGFPALTLGVLLALGYGAQFSGGLHVAKAQVVWGIFTWVVLGWAVWRSEEHTSELQSQSNLVCRLLLEKKKNTI